VAGAGGTGGGMAEAIDGMVLGLVLFFGAHALHGEKRILRAAIAFLADTGLLAPQIAVDGVALRHFVITVTLGKTHAAAVGEFAQQGEYLPLDIGGRTLGRVAEVDLILDLQPAQLSLEHVQFFIGGHWESPGNSVVRRGRGGEVPGGHRGYGTKVIQLLALSYWLLA